MSAQVFYARFPARNLDDYHYEQDQRNMRVNQFDRHNIRQVSQVKPLGARELPRKEDTMTSALPHSAYVPPHLRKNEKKQKSAARKSADITLDNAVQPESTSANLPHAIAQTPNSHSDQRRPAAPPAPPTTDTPNKLICDGKLGDGFSKIASNDMVKGANGSGSVARPVDAAEEDIWCNGTGAADTAKDEVWGDLTKAVRTKTDIIWGNWDHVDTPAQPTQASKQNPRWPREKIPRKHVWPKQREMKAAPSADESEGGINHQSDSNGDPNYDVAKLVGWNGDWMPPPVEWTERHPFASRHFGSDIEDWMKTHPDSCTQDITNLLKSLNFTGVKVDGGVITQDIVPRSWVPVRIEGDAPQTFWRAFSSRAPQALSDIDLTEREPFWMTYSKDGKDCFIPPPEAPIAILDPDDRGNKMEKAVTTAADAVELRKKQRMERARKRQERINRPVSPLPAYVPVTPQLNPMVNIYLRPVDAADAEGIQEIYNWYIANSYSVPEFKPRDTTQILNRMNEVTREKLPYIVAVDRGNRGRNQGRRFVTDKIVGFALLDDYCNRGSMWRYTMELEFYVHHQFAGKGIAKCLIDRLLSTVNPGYPIKGGYEYVNRGEYLKHGAGRVVKTINLSVPHDTADDMEWMTKLMRDFKFIKSGHLRQMGAKKDRIIDMTIYQHITSEPIDPATPPKDPW